MASHTISEHEMIQRRRRNEEEEEPIRRDGRRQQSHTLPRLPLHSRGGATSVPPPVSYASAPATPPGRKRLTLSDMRGAGNGSAPVSSRRPIDSSGIEPYRRESRTQMAVRWAEGFGERRSESEEKVGEEMERRREGREGRSERMGPRTPRSMSMVKRRPERGGAVSAPLER